MKEALNAERKTVLSKQDSLENQVKCLLDGTVNRLRIDDFYSAVSVDKHITICSTAPGSHDNEQLGVFWSSLSALARFLTIAHRIQNPEAAIMADEEKAREFVNELRGLEEESVKKGDKPKKKVSQ